MKVPVTLGKDAVISEAIRIMANKKIGRILVSDNQKITSIATEKDMVFFLLNDQSEKKLEEIPIHKIMKPVLSVSESTSIKSCAKKMLENGIGSLAVTQEGKITGIIKDRPHRVFCKNPVWQKDSRGIHVALLCMGICRFATIQHCIKDD